MLDAAGGLLVGSGYSAITIEKIAAESGVARSTIYRHWENLSEVMDDAVQQLLRPVIDAAIASATAEASTD